MIETNLPRWSVRLDAHRPSGFTDLVPIVAAHYRVHEALEKFLGPYNAKQRSSNLPYRAPDRDLVKELVRRGGMNELSYQAMLNSVVRFCEQTKGNRGLPEPHPSTIHSIQLPQGAFEIKKAADGSSDVDFIGSEMPLNVKGLRDPSKARFIIVRPKLSQLGTASASNWEVLFFDTPHGYIPDWVDSSLNPRYSGRF